MRRLPLTLLLMIVAMPVIACAKADDNAGQTSAGPTTTVGGSSGSSSSPPATSPPGSKPTGTSTKPGTTSKPGTTLAAGKVGRGVNGISTLLAGDGTDSGKGVPGPALAVSLRPSEDIAAAPNGDIYTVDRFGNRLLLVKGGQVTIAFQGDGVKLNGFSGIAISGEGRIVFGTDQGIHELHADGTATLLVDRRATKIGTGYSMAFGPDDMLYVGSSELRLYKIVDGVPTVIAGDGKPAPSTQAKGDGGPALQAEFTHIADLAIDKAGVIYVADDSGGRVRAIATDGVIRTVAGGGPTLVVGVVDVAPEGTPATQLDLGNPVGLAVDAKGTLYIADASNHVIFRLDAKGGLQAVIADVGPVIEQSGKPANQTRTLSPNDLAYHDGTLFYIDRQNLRSIANVDT